MFWIVFVVIALVVCYGLLSRPHKYWAKRGVAQGKPAFIIGDNWDAFIQRRSFAELQEEFYHADPESRYFGIYQFFLPTLIVRDPELIKQIGVKDFDHFLNHQLFVPEDVDPLWGKNLFALNDQKWRDMRSILSPAFTSSKMKFMFSLIVDSCEQFLEHFLKQNQEIVTIEMRDTISRFTNDVIANTAFGVKCDSLGDRNNEFYLVGKDVSNFSGFWKNVKFMGFFLVPKLFRMLEITLFSKKSSNFFINLITDNIKNREKHGIIRPDMIHLLLEARRHGLKYEESQSQDAGFATAEESEIGKKATSSRQELTDTDITAQALIFFFAGFDSVSNLMCFMSHELAVNPDIQQRLINEIDEVRKKCGGRLTYETLMGMKYLDMVTSESMRLWPIAVATDRVCTKPYTIKPERSDEKAVLIEKDVAIWFPVFALHRDPKYFPDPTRFDPERFNDENKHKIEPYTFLPFGVGPRNCIGSRFALLETKALFFYLLSSFEIVPVEKTQIPLKISKAGFNLTAENGFWLGLKRRGNIPSI